MSHQRASNVFTATTCDRHGRNPNVATNAFRDVQGGVWFGVKLGESKFFLAQFIK